MRYVTTIEGKDFLVEILSKNRVRVNDVEYEVDFESVSGQLVYTMLVDGKSYEAHIFEEDDAWHILMQGTLYSAQVMDEREKRLKAAASGAAGDEGEYVLRAPMPGLIVKVPVKEGDEIKKGDVLVILESMKMQNELKAPRDGKVKRVQVKQGESVEQKQTMMVVE